MSCKCIIDDLRGIDELAGLDMNYDVALKRLQVHSSDNWKGIIPPAHNPQVQLPPIYSAKFCSQPGYHQFLALADEDGKVRATTTAVEPMPFSTKRSLFYILSGGDPGH